MNSKEDERDARVMHQHHYKRLLSFRGKLVVDFLEVALSLASRLLLYLTIPQNISKKLQGKVSCILQSHFVTFSGLHVLHLQLQLACCMSYLTH